MSVFFRSFCAAVVACVAFASSASVSLAQTPLSDFTVFEELSDTRLSEVPTQPLRPSIGLSDTENRYFSLIPSLHQVDQDTWVLSEDGSWTRVVSFSDPTQGDILETALIEVGDASAVEISRGLRSNIQVSAVSPDGSHVAVALDREIVLIDLQSGVETRSFSWAEGEVHKLSISEDNGMLAVATRQKLTLYDVTNGRLISSQQLGGNGNNIHFIAVGDDAVLITHSQDGLDSATFYPIHGGEPVRKVFDRPTGDIDYARIDEGVFSIIVQDSSILVFDEEYPNEMLHDFSIRTTAIDIAILDDGRIFATLPELGKGLVINAREFSFSLLDAESIPNCQHAYYCNSIAENLTEPLSDEATVGSNLLARAFEYDDHLRRLEFQVELALLDQGVSFSTDRTAFCEGSHAFDCLSNPNFDLASFDASVFVEGVQSAEGRAIVHFASGELASANELFRSAAVFRDLSARMGEQAKPRSQEVQLMEQLAVGNITYHRPQTMRYGSEVTVRLQLQPDASSDLGVGKRDETDNGEVLFDAVEYGLKTQAVLSGGEFKISPEEGQTRTILPDRTTEWTWVVSPATFGEQKVLSLTTFALLEIDGTEFPPVQIKTVTDTIDIEVGVWDSWKQRLAEIGPMHATALALMTTLAGLLAWIGKRFFSKRKTRVGFRVGD